ncbi:MAG TPA: DNA repair protein RadA [Candidatus Faecousia intestinigallinarum]|nr:DNA repair protein RadA [Candidatus Faecousia intestinigallinarum]
MAKTKTIFYCTECGNETPKWQGRCPACGAWNTLEEHIEKPAAPGRTKTAPVGVGLSRKPQRLNQVETEGELRFSTGMGELDRVLGGGAVAGSLVLVGGAPGIGKSTLLLQICSSLCAGRKVLYVSGEESERQLKLRAQRLGVAPDSLYILSETQMADILSAVEELQPDVLIADSIQTLYSDANESLPGSVSQVKECTMRLMGLAKSQGITVFVVGHINKDGNIAGPKVLEHMVDCVLYFEGDPNTSYRLLRAAKNRFGSTNEIGVFEMRDKGLEEVPNPSQMLLEGRPSGESGTCVACVMEGTRPVLAEVQALVAKTSFHVPRRTADGFDFNRAALLLAVAEKRGGMKLSLFDAYINVIGGLQLDEPGADLPVVLAVASSYRDKPIDDSLAAIGEVGLAGEIRSVSHMNQRLSEVARLGFKTCIIPKIGSGKLEIPEDLTVYRVRNLREAIAVAL